MNDEIVKQTIKGLEENQETAIKLLEENVELKKRIQKAIKFVEKSIVDYITNYDDLREEILDILKGR